MGHSKLIYVTLDLRRALWVPEAVGAKIVCSYKSDLLKWMRERGADVWCFEEEFPDAKIPQTSFLLLSRALTLNMLRGLAADLEFLVFKPSNKIRRWIEEQNWKLISPNVKTCRELEDKLSFSALAKKYDLPMPKNREVFWDQSRLAEYQREFGDKFIVQGRMGHAGNCTYLFSVSEDVGGYSSPLARGERG